ncbi:MAG: DNA-formamidopyrimidine glycosylase family protein, partial [Acidimicrobiales bacterium]|nr:DNA-formamidopyrimidine glycosylase family protein [Acidimicrobiales bacterium]
MPELPEVETIRRQLAPEITNRRVTASGSHESAKFLPARKVEGKRFIQLRRRGKYLIAELDDRTEMIVHLGMTGQLKIMKGDKDRPIGCDYERAWWLL